MSESAAVVAPPESAKAGARLAELCEELLALAVQLRRAAEPPEPDALRREIHRLLSELDRQAGFAGIDSADVHLVRYALVALLDEIVLGSDWPFREAWASRPLQMELFDDFNAGEEFFRKLDSLRGGRSPAAADVLEVYGLCLGLGFMGKHAGLQGMERLSALRTEIAREVARLRGTEDLPLAPGGAPDRPIRAVVRHLPVWVVAAGCAGFLLLLYLVLMLFWSVDEFPSS